MKTQNVRQIDVYLDKQGNHGKSWLTNYLWEHGKCCSVPRYAITPEKLSAYICSSYRNEGLIIIDIPRSAKINPGLYEEVEAIKDGLVYDPRYHGQCRNIRGVKLIIFTNTELDTKRLSHDRWRLHGVNSTEPPHKSPL